MLNPHQQGHKDIKAQNKASQLSELISSILFFTLLMAGSIIATAIFN